MGVRSMYRPYYVVEAGGEGIKSRTGGKWGIQDTRTGVRRETQVRAGVR